MIRICLFVSFVCLGAFLIGRKHNSMFHDILEFCTETSPKMVCYSPKCKHRFSTKWIFLSNKCLVKSMSIASMASPSSIDSFSTLSHGVHQTIHIPNIQCIPCSFQGHTQLLQSISLHFQFLNTPPQHVPHMFYQVQVRRYSLAINLYCMKITLKIKIVS